MGTMPENIADRRLPDGTNRRPDVGTICNKPKNWEAAVREMNETRPVRAYWVDRDGGLCLEMIGGNDAITAAYGFLRGWKCAEDFLSQQP